MSMLGRMFGFGRNERYDRGLRFYDQGLYEQAIEDLSALVADDSDADGLSKRLARFYIAESYSSLGVDFLHKQSFEKARECLGHALALNNHYADLHLHYGRANRKLGKLDEAHEAFQSALAINPRFAKALLFDGLILMENGRVAEGFAEIQQAAEFDPGFATPTFAGAVRAFDSGDMSQAHALFEQVAESDVDDIAYHIGLGSDLYRRAMYEPAIQEFQKALALNSNFADVHNHLAIAYNASGMHDQGVDHLRRALEINPNYVEARSNLALTLDAAGRSEEAITEFKKVLAQDPGNILARERIGRP